MKHKIFIFTVLVISAFALTIIQAQSKESIKEKLSELKGEIDKIVISTDEDQVVFEGEYRNKKKYRWGNMNGQWVEPDIRDSVVGFIEAIIPKTDIQLKKLLTMIGINSSKYYSWNQRKGKANNHIRLGKRSDNKLCKKTSGRRI